jgi:hypothetical protein
MIVMLSPRTSIPRLKTRNVQEGDQQFADHPEAYLPFLKQFRNVLEFAVLKATAHFADPESHPMPVDAEGAPSLENILLRRLQSLPTYQQEIAKLNISTRLERLNILSERDYSELFQEGAFEAFTRTTPMLAVASPLLQDRGQRLRQLVMPLANAAAVGPMSNVMSYTGNVKAILRIHKVRCVDETDPETGDDEISLAGVVVQANGKSRKIDTFMVADDFDGDEQIVYEPPILYAHYDIVGGQENTAFPKYIACFLIMSEIDNGGFPDQFQDLYEHIKTKVLDAINGAVTTAYGPLAYVVSSATGWLMGELWGLFRDIWEDDLFPPQKVDLVFQTPRSNFGGSSYSPMFSAWFNGHGGTYLVNYSWQIVGQEIVIPDSETPPPVPGIEGIVVFKNVNYDGDQKLLKVGTHHFGGGAVEGEMARFLLRSPFDNEIDSIKVGPGYYAWLFKSKDCSGTRLEITQDTPFLSDEWRDQISSIIVIKRG